MNLEFINGFSNTANACLAFKDEGIFWYSDNLNLSFPWGSIEKISVNYLSIVTITTIDDKKYVFAANTGEKKILKSIIQYAMPIIKSSEKATVIKTSKLSESEKMRLFDRGELNRIYPDDLDNLVNINYTKEDNDRVNNRVTKISILAIIIVVVGAIFLFSNISLSKKDDKDSKGYYNSSEEEAEHYRQKANEWMQENWDK